MNAPGTTPPLSERLITTGRDVVSLTVLVGALIVVERMGWDARGRVVVTPNTSR